MTERPRKDEIFNAAAEITDIDERAAFIAEACGDDSALRAEIDELLRHDDAEDSLLDRSAAGFGATVDHPITERPGTQIGPFKLLQQIGEGGFGVVYMAEQHQPVRRKVALKIIKPGMDTKEVVARFESERQALALMDHPNIAKIFDAGTTETGRPFFVMELVKGVPLNQFCDENSLTTQERLNLFVTVCRAIQHAHQKGVIHRDLKPSNVMVTLHDNKPVPKVIDFGVSKAISQQLTEKTLFTAYGQMVGTPIYMSPEQAQMSGLDVDTRSDIYSLGVVLFELLTGSTPLSAEKLRQSGYAEMQRLIREEEAPKPSLRLSTESGEAQALIAKHRGTDSRQLGNQLRGDLDWIVIKALEKDRNRRYDTANSFADDVERFLQNDYVEACPPSVGYRLKKFVSRNKVAFTTGAVVLATLLAGIAATTWQWIDATNQRIKADEARDEAVVERNKADGARKEAETERANAVAQKKKAVASAKKAALAKTKAEQESQRADRERALAETAKYAMQLKLADIHYDNFELPAARKLLAETKPALRNWEYDLVKQRCDGRMRSFGKPRAWFAVDITPDGRLVAGGGKGGTVDLFDYDTRQRVAELKVDGPAVIRLSFSPDGKRLACATETTISMWDVATRQRLGKIEFAPAPKTSRPFSSFFDSTRLITFDADGKRLAIGLEQEIHIWDATLSTKHRTFKTGPGKLMSIDFDPVRNRLAALHRAEQGKRKGGPGPDTILIYNIDSGQLQKQIVAEFGNRPFVRFDPQGRSLLGAGLAANANIGSGLSSRDAETGQAVVTPYSQFRILGDGGFGLSEIDLSADGNRVVLAPFITMAIFVVDVAAGGVVKSVPMPETIVRGSFGNMVRAVGMSADGRRIVAATIHSFSTNTRSQTDAGRLVGVTMDGDASIVDLHTKSRGSNGHWTSTDVICEKAGWIARTTRYPRHVIGDSIDFDTTYHHPPLHFVVEFFSLETGDILFCLRRHQRAFGTLFASRDGNSLFEVHDSTVDIWDLQTRRRKRTIQLEHARARFSGRSGSLLNPDAGLLATVEGVIHGNVKNRRNQVVVRDLSNGKVLWQTQSTARILRIRDFSPDGSRLLIHTQPPRVGSPLDPKTGEPIFQEYRLRIYEARSGKRVAETKESFRHLAGVRFVAESRVLFSDQLSLRSWDSTTGLISTIANRGGEFELVRNGTRLMMSWRGALRVIDVATMQEVYQRAVNKYDRFRIAPSGNAILIHGFRTKPRLMRIVPAKGVPKIEKTPAAQTR